MRRVTLATELINYPSILFCDEPTSGLDSYMAETVIRTLRKLVVLETCINNRQIKVLPLFVLFINHPQKHTLCLIELMKEESLRIGHVFG